MSKPKNNYSLVKVAMIILLSFLFFHIIIFTTQIIYPMPVWREVCQANGGCGMGGGDEVLGQLSSVYYNNIKVMYLIIFSLCLIIPLVYVLYNKTSTKELNKVFVYTFFGIALLSLWHAFLSQLGDLYFEFGKSPSKFVLSSFVLLIIFIAGILIFNIKKNELFSKNKKLPPIKLSKKDLIQFVIINVVLVALFLFFPMVLDYDLPNPFVIVGVIVGLLIFEKNFLNYLSVALYNSFIFSSLFLFILAVSGAFSTDPPPIYELSFWVEGVSIFVFIAGSIFMSSMIAYLIKLGYWKIASLEKFKI